MNSPTSRKQSSTPDWNAPVVVASVPETGRRLDLVADEATRNSIAKAAGLAALPRLEAGFDLTRQGAEGLRVVGRVSASVVQNCIVTLEPIESQLDEAVDLVFLSANLLKVLEGGWVPLVLGIALSAAHSNEIEGRRGFGVFRM